MKFIEFPPFSQHVPSKLWLHARNLLRSHQEWRLEPNRRGPMSDLENGQLVMVEVVVWWWLRVVNLVDMLLIWLMVVHIDGTWVCHSFLCNTNGSANPRCVRWRTCWRPLRPVGVCWVPGERWGLWNDETWPCDDGNASTILEIFADTEVSIHVKPVHPGAFYAFHTFTNLKATVHDSDLQCPQVSVQVYIFLYIHNYTYQCMLSFFRKVFCWIATGDFSSSFLKIPPLEESPRKMPYSIAGPQIKFKWVFRSHSPRSWSLG